MTSESAIRSLSVTIRISIVRAVDTTLQSSSGSVLRIDVRARIEGHADEKTFEFDWLEWEEYDDSSPESMAAGLAVLIRTDIREEIATQRS